MENIMPIISLCKEKTIVNELECLSYIDCEKTNSINISH